MDLSKVTFPTFVLEPRSMLERITDFMSHPDLIFGYAAPLVAPQPVRADNVLLALSLARRTATIQRNASSASCNTTWLDGT